LTAHINVLQSPTTTQGSVSAQAWRVQSRRAQPVEPAALAELAAQVLLVAARRSFQERAPAVRL